MNEKKTFKGASTEEAWDQFKLEYTWQESPNNYRAVIHAGEHKIDLETVRSPGGSEEGWGFGRTIFKAPVPVQSEFRFAIVPEDFLNRIGKFFGMQDVRLGYPEFDNNVLVQTNDEQKLKSIFADATLREIFQNQSGYSFHIEKSSEGEGDDLHLNFQRAITHPDDLRIIFNAFYKVLTALD